MKWYHKFFAALILMTAFGVAFGGKLTDNIWRFGEPGTSDPIKLLFDVNDGANNPEIEADNGIIKFNNATVTSPVISGGTITGADIDGGTASNTKRLTLPKDTTSNLTSLTRKAGTVFYDTTQSNLVFDDGANIRAVGSGSGGGGGINLLSNSDFDQGITGWTETGSTTFAAQTSEVGFGSNAASWDAGAAAQKVVTTATTISKIMVGAACNASLYYKGGDANITLRVVDGAATVLDSVVLSAETDWKSSAQLFFPCGTTSTSTLSLELVSTADAAIIYFDRVFVGQGGLGSTYVGTKWQAFTPVWVGGAPDATPVSSLASYRRDGPDMLIEYELRQDSSGTNGAVNELTIPGGHSALGLQSVGSGGGLGFVMGSMQASDATAAITTFYPKVQTATTISFLQTASTVTFGSGSTLSLATANLRMKISLRVAISGWENSGNTLTMSDNVIHANARMRAVSTSTSTIAHNATHTLWTSEDYDTANAFNMATGIYTAPTTGYYRVNVMITGTGATAVTANIQRAGVSQIVGASISTTQGIATGVFYATKGQEIRIVRSGGGTLTLGGAIENNFLEIERLSDFSAGSPVGVTTADATHAGLVSKEIKVGTFTGVWSDGGATAAPANVTYSYTRVGNMVQITPNSNHSAATASAANVTISGVPSTVCPTASTSVAGGLNIFNGAGNNASGLAVMSIVSGSTCSLAISNGGQNGNSFTASGTKGLVANTVMTFFIRD